MVVAAAVEDEVRSGTLEFLDIYGFAPSYPLFLIYDVYDSLDELGR